jgi:hypothetical protein
MEVASCSLQQAYTPTPGRSRQTSFTRGRCKRSLPSDRSPKIRLCAENSALALSQNLATARMSACKFPYPNYFQITLK